MAVGTGVPSWWAVLIGHSYGGLIVRLSASTYPRQVAGLVLVDAMYELLRELLPPDQWAAVARVTLEPALEPSGVPEM